MTNGIDYHEEILNSLQIPRRDRASARKFLASIGAPESKFHGAALIEVAQSMLSILDLAPQIDTEILDDATLRKYQDLSQRISDSDPSDFSGIAEESSGRDSFYGLYTSYPRFCALGATTSNSMYFEQHLTLKAQAWVSYVRLDTIAVKGEKLDSTFYTGSRGIRYIGSEEFSHLLHEFPIEPSPTPVYINDIQAFVHAIDPDSRTVVDWVIMLLRRGVDLVGDSKSPDRESGTRGRNLISTQAKPHWSPTFFLDGDEESAASVRIAEQEPTVNTDGKRELSPCDAPFERRSGTVALEVNERPDPELSWAPADTLFRARGTISAIAKVNQHLAVDWEVLPPQEIAILLEAIDNGDFTPADPPVPTHTLSALIATLLWTGFGLKTALSARIKTNPIPTSSRRGGPPTLVTDDEQSLPYWECPVIGPKRVGRHPLDANRPPEILNLSVHPWLFQKLKPLIEQRFEIATSGNSNSRKTLFPKIRNCRTQVASQIVYSEAINAFLSAVNRKHRTHWTMRRLEWMFSRILTAETHADRVDAHLLTGSIPGTATNSLYYIRRRAATLLDLHRSGQNILDSALVHISRDKRRKWRSIQRSALANQTESTPQDDLFNQREDRYSLRVNGIGSPFFPEIIDIQKLAVDLRNGIIEARNKGIRDQSLIEIHNAMTAYTVIMASFGLGFRAVAHPFSRWTDLDEERGLLVLMDKDSGDGYGARLVWVPDVVIMQLQNYRKHLLFLAERLGLRDPTLQRRIYSTLDPDFTDPDAEYLAPFFMLDPRMNPHPTSPSWLERYVLHFGPEDDDSSEKQCKRGKLRYPPNACRHFLASQLREHNVSEDIVSAYLGHWQLGQEPWACYSALSPLDYVAQLKPVLNHLMTECGWIPLKGADAR